MTQDILFQVFIFLSAACAVVPLASRFKLGSVLGYLAAGVLIGPFGLAFIGNAEQIMHFAEFGVVMMLFLIGLELEPAMLWRLRKSIIGLGSLQVILTSAAFTSIGIALGYSWQSSLAIGMALSLSSTALVLQILNEKNLMQTSIGETSFSVLLFQDIAVIFMLLILPLLTPSESAISAGHDNLLSTLPLWARSVATAGIIATVIITGRYLSHHLFRAMAKTNIREVFTATSLALVVGITLLMQAIGISPALGAFIAGVVLANSSYKRTLETDIEPFKGLLLGLFFISVGMSMDFHLLASRPFQLVAAVTALVAVKTLILIALATLFRLTSLHSIGFALALAQGSEFAFVLLGVSHKSGIISASVSDFITLTVAMSMAATPFLMLLYSKWIVPRFMSALPERSFDSIDSHHSIILAGYGRFGQIIGRFITGQGTPITILEKDPDQIDLLRKFGFIGFFGDATRLDLLKSAGADKAKLLIVAVDDAETCTEIVKLAREEFPNLTIFARARNRRHAFELDRLGVAYFKRETFDSSLEMAKQVMLFLGKSEEEVQSKAATFIAKDEETLRKSFAVMDKESELVAFAHTARSEMERLLQDDSKIK